MHVQFAFKSCSLSEKIVTGNHKSRHVGTRHGGMNLQGNRVSNDRSGRSESAAHGSRDEAVRRGENGRAPTSRASKTL